MGLVLVYTFVAILFLYRGVVKKTDEPKVIEAFILTNGVHTDLVVPVKNDLMDWGKELPLIIQFRRGTILVMFLLVGGRFYPDTPSWAELQPYSIFAAFWIRRVCHALQLLF